MFWNICVGIKILHFEKQVSQIRATTFLQRSVTWFIACSYFGHNRNATPGPWFNIKMSFYQHRKSHCGDKTILRPSYLQNGISFTGKMRSLYWIGALTPTDRSSWWFTVDQCIAGLWHHKNRYCDIILVQCFWWLKLGAVSIRKTVLPGMAIPMLKIRRPNGRLIFNMEIAIRR